MLVRFILVFLILIAVSLPFAVPLWQGEDPVPPTERPAFEAGNEASLFEVRTRVFERETFSNLIEVTAQTQADKVRSLRAEVGGQIDQVFVERGQRVAVGARIASIKAETRDAQLSQAQVQLAQAEQDLAATQQLVDQNVVAENQLLAAQAVYESALASLRSAQQQQEDLVITASVAGLITDVSVEPGATINPSEPVATVLALDPLLITARVSELEIGNVSEGQPITATLVTGESVEGEISYIAPRANAQTRTFDIEAEVANPDYALRDGVTATLFIPRPQVQAVRIPQSALVTDDDTQELGVRFVDENDTAQFAAVEWLQSDVESAWVMGIADGTRIIVTGQRFVEVGDKVKPVDAQDVLDAAQRVEEQLADQ